MLSRFINNGPAAVIRLTDRKKLDGVLNAVIEGGLRNLEITMTVPGAIDVIKELCSVKNKNLMIGAGTIISLTECEAVINAGAEFIVSPILNADVIAYTKANGKISLPGCLTPTEMLLAHNRGADIIKVFPATCFGPRYFREILAPFPFLKLMPTGGVSIDNVAEWIQAGAITVAIGSDLLDKKSLEDENYNAIQEKTIKLIKNYFEAKNMFNKK